MRINDLNEGVAGTLYHVMNMYKAESVFEKDWLEAKWTHTIGNNSVMGTSFSRNKRFWFGEQYVVKIAIDTDKIKRKTRVYPLDAEHVYNMTHFNREPDYRDRMGRRRHHHGEFAEEFVAGDLNPLHTYLESIEIRNTLGISRNMVYRAKAYAEKYNIPLHIDPNVVSQLYQRELEAYQNEEPYPDPMFYHGDTPNLEEGYRLPLDSGTIPRARGSYGAFITTMHARDFLRLTTLHDDHIEEIKSRSFPYSKEQYREVMGRDEGFGKFWMPFLNVAFPSGKVLGHEGRHRAAMILAHGGDLIPVIIYPKTDEEYLATVEYWDEDDGRYRKLVTDDAYSTRKEALIDIKNKILRMGIPEDDLREIKTEFVGHSTLKGEPTRSQGWERAKWLVSDFPDQLIGQFNPSVVVPRNHFKIGLVKGYRHFSR